MVSGRKTITGDVSITNLTVLQNINGININNLESNAMTTDGDQELSGTFIIAEAHAERYMYICLLLLYTSSEYEQKSDLHAVLFKILKKLQILMFVFCS